MDKNKKMLSHFKLKILILGSAAAGKTSLIQRYIKGKFQADYKLTVGTDILTKDVEFRQGEIATLSIWDTGGQQRFEFIRSTFYKGAAGALLVFDLTREQTYVQTRKWLKEVRQFAGENIPFVLIGNKADLLKEFDQVIIDPDKARSFAENEDSIYLETSAKTGKNVADSFMELARKIIEKKPEVLTYPAKRVRNLKNLFIQFFENPNRTYNELLKNLKDFNEIQNTEEFNALTTIYEKSMSMDSRNLSIYMIKLYLLRLLYDYSLAHEELLINTADFSEKIAIECYKLAESLDSQDYNKIEINNIKELFNNIEFNDRSIFEYLIELFCYFLLSANLIFLRTNYHRIQQYFFEEEDKEIIHKEGFKALYDLANYKQDYYDLLKYLTYGSEHQDVNDLDIALVKYLKVKNSIPKDIQTQIDLTFDFIQKTFQKIKISRWEIKEQIFVNETYNILELAIKNNTLNETLGFYIQIDPIGFENFSYRDPFKRYYRLRPKEEKPISLDLGIAKTAGRCPIHFTFSYKNNIVFHEDVHHIEVKKVLKRIKPNIKIIEVETESKKLTGFNTLNFDLKIENKEETGYVLRIVHNGARHFGRLSPDYKFWIKPKSTEDIKIMFDLPTEKIIRPMRYPLEFSLLHAENNIRFDRYELEVEVKAKRGAIAWRIFTEASKILPLSKK